MGMVTRDPNIPAFVGAEIQFITEADTLKDRGDIMKSIGSFTEDFKIKVQLRRRGKD